MIYQLMFAIITPALSTGAFAERMKFSAMLLFMALLALIVYFPMAYMVWGKGGLLNAYLGGKFPCFDFAGGAVVHITSGVSALVCALYLGKRVGHPSDGMKPHSLVISFNRSKLVVGRLVRIQRRQRAGRVGPGAQAVRGPQLRRRGGNAGRGIAEWLRTGKPSVLGAISGAVAGLVAITPASGFVQPVPAVIIGLAAGVVCYFMVTLVKQKFGYDDSLDAFGVHGAGGTLGAILTGVFATNAVNDALKDPAGKVMPLGLVDGNGGQILNQAIGVGIAWALAIVGTVVILKICDGLLGLRVEKEQEIQGLDLSMHGEEGYILES